MGAVNNPCSSSPNVLKTHEALGTGWAVLKRPIVGLQGVLSKRPMNITYRSPCSQVSVDTGDGATPAMYLVFKQNGLDHGQDSVNQPQGHGTNQSI